MENSLKLCRTCGESKPLAEFPRDSWKPCGLKSLCKECDAAKARRYYAANREKVIARVIANRKRAGSTT